MLSVHNNARTSMSAHVCRVAMYCPSHFRGNSLAMLVYGVIGPFCTPSAADLAKRYSHALLQSLKLIVTCFPDVVTQPSVCSNLLHCCCCAGRKSYGQAGQIRFSAAAGRPNYCGAGELPSHDLQPHFLSKRLKHVKVVSL